VSRPRLFARAVGVSVEELGEMSRRRLLIAVFLMAAFIGLVLMLGIGPHDSVSPKWQPPPGCELGPLELEPGEIV
jgi:hypothetical protein